MGIAARKNIRIYAVFEGLCVVEMHIRPDEAVFSELLKENRRERSRNFILRALYGLIYHGDEESLKNAIIIKESKEKGDSIQKILKNSTVSVYRMKECPKGATLSFRYKNQLTKVLLNGMFFFQFFF